MDPEEQKRIDERKARNEKIREAALPLIKLLAEEFHPHHTAIVTSNSVEVLEGVCSFPQINDFIKD